MRVTVESLMKIGGLNREDAIEVAEYIETLSASIAEKRTEKTEQPRRTAPCGCFVSSTEFARTPIEYLDHRIQVAIRAELDRTGRSSFWQVLCQKPLSEACNAAELGKCFQVLG